ncbi:hypothetical protein SeMB42_g08005 [Synchytrium endobioticum]|uniref:Uncharacterized protein n=1 Tax=Synchytrium endobioticum TaxID=286115 RepID=A0A507BW35_9FUNG|nr:hypothetical protein SeMB42_g08005 [Synchytrium endobioticum]TPX47466.1 hypothetical protein SeLEV6574_g02647 [Synchytrium endobioticum]
MFFPHQKHYEQVYNSSDDIPEENKASLTHEVLGGAVGFFAMKAYEDHQRKLGHPVHHQFAKEILAAIATAEVDRLAETKGLNWIDRQKAKRCATAQAHQIYDQQHGDKSMEYYDQNSFDWDQFNQNAQQFRAPLGRQQETQPYQQYSQQPFEPQQYDQQNYQQGYPAQEYPRQQYPGPQY